jgi:hypothetical protein
VKFIYSKLKMPIYKFRSNYKPLQGARPTGAG